MPLDQVLQEVKSIDREFKQLKHDIAKLCWFMRGGVTLDEAYAMSYEDREIMSELVKENLETTKRSGMPFF